MIMLEKPDSQTDRQAGRQASKQTSRRDNRFLELVCDAVRDQHVASDQTPVVWIGCICRCCSSFRGHRLDFQDATRLAPGF